MAVRPEDIAKLSPELRASMAAMVDDALARRKLQLYKPYAKQRLFHRAGKDHSERLLMAGNQLGKSIAEIGRAHV